MSVELRPATASHVPHVARKSCQRIGMLTGVEAKSAARITPLVALENRPASARQTGPTPRASPTFAPRLPSSSPKGVNYAGSMCSEPSGKNGGAGWDSIDSENHLFAQSAAASEAGSEQRAFTRPGRTQERTCGQTARMCRSSSDPDSSFR